MPDILKPDAGKLLWLALGFFVAPMVVSYVRQKLPARG